MTVPPGPAGPPRRPGRPGAAAVELALLLPLLAVLFSATVDFARVLHATQVLENAACVGAMTAAGTYWTPGYPGTAEAAARAAACAEGPTFAPGVVGTDVSVRMADGMATVTVGCTYALATGLLMPSATVRLERTVSVPMAPRPGS